MLQFFKHYKRKKTGVVTAHYQIIASQYKTEFISQYILHAKNNLK